MYNHELLTKAIKFATDRHEGMIRKGSESNPLPYILHPMESATIAATMSRDVNVIVAALLHDVVEDTKTSIETIKVQFNDVVAKLVADQSEDKREDLPEADTWEIRKQETLDQLRFASKDSKIVTLSDKLSNMRSLVSDYSIVGDSLWDRFNQTDVKRQAWYYKSLKNSLLELKAYDAWKEYSLLVDKLFKD